MMIALTDISVYQWLGLFFGILYIVFAAFSYNQCWIYAFVSTICIAVEDFIHLKLYFDGALQLFYALMAICGLIIWVKGSGEKREMRITKLSLKTNIGYIAVSVLIAMPAAYLLGENSDAAFPYLDGLTSALSVVATFLMIYKVLDSWRYWIVVNIIILCLYYVRGAPLISVLYLIYTVFAFLGFIKWSKAYNEQRNTSS